MEKAIYPRSSANDPVDNLVSRHLPRVVNSDKIEDEQNFSMDLLKKSEVVDGTEIRGVGSVLGHSYRWRLIVESGVRSVAQVPDRFFDIEGRSYPIQWNSKVSVFNGEAPTYSNFKDAIIYKIDKGGEAVKAHPYIIFDAWMDNHGNSGVDGATASLQEYLTKYDYNASTEGTLVTSEGTDSANAAHNVPFSDHGAETLAITSADYLAIVVDNNNNYHAYVGTGDTKDQVNYTTDSKVKWYAPNKEILTSQFKGLDMWLRFEGINSMIYFILTKYNQDIMRIAPAKRIHPNAIEYRLLKSELVDGEWGENVTVTNWTTDPITKPEDTSTIKYTLETRDTEAKVDEDYTQIAEYDESEEKDKYEGRLWAYVNPRTMKPFADDYWFHEGEPYYIKSLTIAPKSKQIKANRITITPDQWPGMYMMVGETYIRDKETGEDERMQIRIPLCKVKADQTITLEADGEPTTFSLNLEVARPRTGALMEITAYEVAKKMELGSNGCYYAVDGSSEVVIE